jgi:hypothetical protein
MIFALVLDRLGAVGRIAGPLRPGQFQLADIGGRDL